MDTRTKYFRVAEHTFALEMASDSPIWGLATQYSPFEIEASATLFSMRHTATPRPTEGYEMIFEDNIDNPEFPRLKVYESAEGTIFEMLRHSDESVYGTIFIANDLTHGEFNAEAATPIQLRVLHFALTMHFTMAAVQCGSILFHSSAVIVGGKAYLFLGKSGTGKSTHNNMWREYFGAAAELLNDDHPVVGIDRESGEVYAYGSPWSGSTPCYKNLSAPVGAIVRIKRGAENRVRRLRPIEAYASLSSSCSSIRWSKQQADAKDQTISNIVKGAACYEIECLPNVDAAKVCAAAVCK